MVFKHVKAIGYGKAIQHEDKALYDLLQARAILHRYFDALNSRKKNESAVIMRNVFHAFVVNETTTRLDLSNV